MKNIQWEKSREGVIKLVIETGLIKFCEQKIYIIMMRFNIIPHPPLKIR